MARSERMNRSELEDKVYALSSTLREMAMAKCVDGEPDAVHFIVTEERKLHSLIRAMENRGIITTTR